MIHCPFSEQFKNRYWNIPCFSGWAVSGDYSRFSNDCINQLFWNRIPKYSKIVFWWKRLSDLHNCLPVLVAPDPVHPRIFSRQFLFSSCGQLTISFFDYYVSHLNDDIYYWNNDLKDAFFADSRGDERVHMPIGLVKLFHIAETEPEQFYRPDCARGQCKNQCLCVQLTLHTL